MNCNTTLSEREAGRAQANSCSCAALDVIELPEEYRVEVDVPGAGKDDVELRAEDGTLFLNVRVPKTAPTERRYHLREHGPREIARRIGLGDSVDANAITAEVAQGVLTIHLPKLAAARPRRIDVR